jgi:hypothetical protein
MCFGSPSVPSVTARCCCPGCVSLRTSADYSSHHDRFAARKPMELPEKSNISQPHTHTHSLSSNCWTPEADCCLKPQTHKTEAYLHTLIQPSCPVQPSTGHLDNWISPLCLSRFSFSCSSTPTIKVCFNLPPPIRSFHHTPTLLHPLGSTSAALAAAAPPPTIWTPNSSLDIWQRHVTFPFSMTTSVYKP